jgi:hypothetical protein
LEVNVSNIETNIELPTQAQFRSINYASDKNEPPTLSHSAASH